VTFDLAKKVNVAGGPHEATSISFVVERVLWFLHQDVVSTLRSERLAIVDAVYPDGAFLLMISSIVGGFAAVVHDTMKLLSRPSKFLSFFISSCYPSNGVT